ncbi:MAG: phosphate starvation-inducible protein PsiF [Xanthobacteraceae bacterium]|nr:phosphate starvation-inducible protein PsiF [Xanthobacteraceae bacterium]
MRTLSTYLAAATVAAFVLTGTAFAQSTTTAPAGQSKMAPAGKMAPANKMAPAKTKPERTAMSIECSKQADAKGLHGKARKKFRSECKKHGGKMN